MSAEKLPIRSYSHEELRLLAAEGRLKGRGIDSLVNLRPGRAARDREIGQAAFESLCAGLPCWTDPIPLLNTFIELVRLPSPSGSETEVASYLSAELQSLSPDGITTDPIGNLVATFPATSDQAPGLLFTAHMDCVYPGDRFPVVPVFGESGEIRTDGSNSLGADDKAGIAAILATLGYIRGTQVPHGPIRVLFTVQEEIGFRGIKQVPASILNGIHLVLSMDPPVRVGRDETAHMAVLHMLPGHPLVPVVRQAAQDCGLSPTVLFEDQGYVGGDTICLSPLGASVVDFCSCSRYPHTSHEHLWIQDLLGQTNWMVATAERALELHKDDLELRAVYGEEPIGNLTDARKQIPLTEEVLREKIELARTVHTREGTNAVHALHHLSAIAPRIGDRELLYALLEAYGRCLRLDQIPQVLRDLTASLVHLASNLADVRPLEPLIEVAQGVIDRGGDETARVNALRFLEEIFQKERRVVVKARLLRILILGLQSSSATFADALIRFFRANLDDTIHALTVAFCNRNRAGWERTFASGSGRIINGRSRGDEGARWILIRQRILQLLLEEDRILPEMLEWIFTHDGAATQKIAVAFIDPDRTTQVAGRILQNLKSRQPGVQETAVHFVGTHRMVQGIPILIELLLNPYLCRNRSLVEWALDAIGQPALAEVISRLSIDAEYDAFVRRMFNRHDTTTEVDFAELPHRLEGVYGRSFSLNDPSMLGMLGHYLGEPEIQRLEDLSPWDKRRAIVFYDQISQLYPREWHLVQLAEVLEGAVEGTRLHFLQMAVQKNIFDDADFMSLVSRENPRFLEHFVRLEKQIPRHVLLSRLRELMAGAQLDMSDPQDVEIYYLYLLKQSTRMPDRTRYLKHIEEARRHLFPPLMPYCKAFTITGDRIEEVGTVDRQRIRALIEDLPQASAREERLRLLLSPDILAKRERQRLVNGLSEALGIDVTAHSTLEARADALLDAIDYEFDSAYRPVPQVVFPILLRVRMKHRTDAVVDHLADHAIEYALINHPEIADIFGSGELDLILDNLNDLLTDRVYEAERDLSEDVFAEFHDKHVAALAQFYTSQWKGIIRDLKKHFPDGREAELIATTERAMQDFNVRSEEDSDLLDTNLQRLVAVLRPSDPDLLGYHRRHREFYRVYTAVLRVRNIRQLKRIYLEVRNRLQDEISFATR
ncbi:MAG: M20/M25/M40 family metallo-hydrolase, partial [Candidatus Latescibacteria bacterium]|nr:M20/M25/M40 family metallo-hydrolase [Candidatus Latescibacterota bacterium]